MWIFSVILGGIIAILGIHPMSWRFWVIILAVHIFVESGYRMGWHEGFKDRDEISKLFKQSKGDM